MTASAKLDLTTADREAMKAAGIRPPVAAAIVTHRDAHGPFARIDALLDVAGVGAATVEQIRGLAVVAAAPAVAQAVVKATEAAAEAGRDVVAPVAEEAQAATLRLVDAAAATTAQAPARAPDVAAEAAPATAEAAATVVAGEAGPAAGDLAGLWLALAGEQMSHGLEATKALLAARTLREVADVQAAFMAATLRRFLDGTSRAVSLGGKALTDLAATGERETRRAA